MISPAHLSPRVRPKASILLITYNHEKYIAQALEGVLMQETEYSYEINVVDDCSTDRTQEIILGYQARYPDRINTYFNRKNIGTLSPPMQKVCYAGFKTLKGEYTCILEGDDYWSSPHKLQKQISFLDANPEFVACAHNTVKIYEGNAKEPHRFLYWERMNTVYDIKDFSEMAAFFHTSSVLYRNIFMGAPPRVFRSGWSCDIFTLLSHVQYGKLRYFDEDMSVYRQHAGGSFSNWSELRGRIFNIEGLRRYDRWLGYRYLKGFAFALYRLTVTLIGDADAGRVAPLTRAQRRKLKTIAAVYGWIYDLIDRHPKLDPAVFWYRERPKPSQPRLERKIQ